MKLYKYRSLANIEFTLDILINQRLHCAPFEKLNDPLEGIFLSVLWAGGALGMSTMGALPFGGISSVKSARSVSEMRLLGNSRVCSLARNLNDIRLWSHYADGHCGVAIEIDIDESDSLLHEVEYVDRLKESGVSLLGGPRSEEILRVKTIHWTYEQEYRIISDQEFYPVTDRITGIYFGLRASNLIQKSLLAFLPSSISAYRMKLDERKLEIIPGERLDS